MWDSSVGSFEIHDGRDLRACALEDLNSGKMPSRPSCKTFIPIHSFTNSSVLAISIITTVCGAFEHTVLALISEIETTLGHIASAGVMMISAIMTTFFGV
jgi:hypothetical protein